MDQSALQCYPKRIPAVLPFQICSFGGECEAEEAEDDAVGAGHRPAIEGGQQLPNSATLKSNGRYAVKKRALMQFV